MPVKKVKNILKNQKKIKSSGNRKKKRRKKLQKNNRKHAKNKQEESYQKTDPDSSKYDPKYAQELTTRHGSNLETQKNAYNFAEQFSPKPITKPIRSAVDRKRAKELYEESIQNTEKLFDAIGFITGGAGITTRFTPSMTQYALPAALTGTIVDTTSAMVTPDTENTLQATGGLIQTIGAADLFKRIPGKCGVGLDAASDCIGTLFDLYGIGKPVVKVTKGKYNNGGKLTHKSKYKLIKKYRDE